MIHKLKDCTVYFHDSPKTLTAEAHKDFGVLLSQEKDIGSDIESIKQRATDALMHFDSDSKASKNAIMNIWFTIDSMKNKISYNGRALAMLVDKIVIGDKEIRPGYTDQELDETIKLLSDHGLTQEMVETLPFDLKKK